MTIAEILALLGVAEPLIEKGVAVIEGMINAGSKTAAADQVNDLATAVTAAKAARAQYEAGNL